MTISAGGWPGLCPAPRTACKPCRRGNVALARPLLRSRVRIRDGILRITGFAAWAFAAVAIVGCDSERETGASAEGVKVGFIYVGPKDGYGYHQTHAEGAWGVGKTDGATVVGDASVEVASAVRETC